LTDIFVVDNETPENKQRQLKAVEEWRLNMVILFWRQIEASRIEKNSRGKPSQTKVDPVRIYNANKSLSHFVKNMEDVADVVNMKIGTSIDVKANDKFDSEALPRAFHTKTNTVNEQDGPDYKALVNNSGRILELVALVRKESSLISELASKALGQDGQELALDPTQVLENNPYIHSRMRQVHSVLMELFHVPDSLSDLIWKLVSATFQFSRLLRSQRRIFIFENAGRADFRDEFYDPTTMTFQDDLQREAYEDRVERAEEEDQQPPPTRVLLSVFPKILKQSANEDDSHVIARAVVLVEDQGED
jgi:hypothetical protein